MNKVERIHAALMGTAVDRVPASFWFHFPPDQAYGEATVKAHLRYYRESNIDFLKVMNEYFYQSPNVPLQTPSDWRRLRPATLSTSFFQAQLNVLKSITDQLQGECLVIATVYNPFACGNQASGRLLTDHLKADPSSVSAGLAAIATGLAEFASACIDAGASGIYFAAQGGERTRFTTDEFSRYIKPHDLTVLEAVTPVGEFHLLHVCKDDVRLELYADYPSHAVSWAATKRNPNLKQGYALFKRTIVGGLDERGVITTGTPEVIRATAQKVITNFGTKNFMLGADCTLPSDIPIESIRAAIEGTGLDTNDVDFMSSREMT